MTTLLSSVYITHGCHHLESHHEQIPPGLVLFHPVCSNRKGSGLEEARGNRPLLLLEESDHSQRGLLSPWTTLQGSSQLPWGVFFHVGEDGFCAAPEKKVFNPRKEEIRGDTIIVFWLHQGGKDKMINNGKWFLSTYYHPNAVPMTSPLTHWNPTATFLRTV